MCFPEMNMEPSKERTYESKDCYRVFIISKNSDYIQDRLGTGWFLAGIIMPSLPLHSILQNQKVLHLLGTLIVCNTFKCAKVQLISKWFLGSSISSKKRTKTSRPEYHSSKVEFIRSFSGGNRWPPKTISKSTDFRWLQSLYEFAFEWLF